MNNNLVIADLHLHSKYSRAVSQRMDLGEIARWATKKGIDLVATADWTHPLWFKELEANLLEKEPGLFALKNNVSEVSSSLRFLLSVEVSSIFSQGGKVRRVHIVILSPSLAVCKKVQKAFNQAGVNLNSDGRPIMGLNLIQLVELLWSVDENIFIIPAHVWTPWFSLYGSSSGFDSIDEAFGQYAKKITCIETGLSSDPAMNWSIRELDNRTIISSSDAHSGQKLGREATVFRIKNPQAQFSYQDIVGVLKKESKSNLEIAFTIEFFPEEGKYHYSGHRNCNVCLDPTAVQKNQGLCPKCGRPLTIGVMDRIQTLTKKLLLEKDLIVKDSQSRAKLLFHPTQKRPPFISIIPLMEIVAQLENVAPESKKVTAFYEQLIQSYQNEFHLLLFEQLVNLEKNGHSALFKALSKMRRRQVQLLPGYDGVFGKILVDVQEENSESAKEALDSNQESLF